MFRHEMLFANLKLGFSNQKIYKLEEFMSTQKCFTEKRYSIVSLRKIMPVLRNASDHIWRIAQFKS